MSSSLRKLARSKFNSRIKNLYIGDKCERCGCTENLQLHHCCFLHIIVNNVLNYFRVEEKESIDEYDEETVYKILSCIMAEHLKIRYKTLCSDCHIKEHEECTSDRFNGCGASYHKKTWDLTDKQIEYLDIYLNTKRYGRETLREIIKVLDCKDEYDRLYTTVDEVNSWFEERNVPYFIEMGKELDKSLKKYGCLYYIIRLL